MKAKDKQSKQTTRSRGSSARKVTTAKGAEAMNNKGKKRVSLLKREDGRYIITSPRGRSKDYLWRSLIVLDNAYGKPVPVQEMYETTGYSNPTVYRRSVIRRLVDEQLATYDSGTDELVITLVGTQLVKEWEHSLN